MRLINVFIIAAVMQPGLARAAPGEADPTWAYPEPVVLEPDSTDVVPMPSGWMVVQSRLPPAPATTATLELTRIDADGRPIASFGNAGRVTVPLPGPFNVSFAAAATSDGGFVAAGYKRRDATQDTVAAVIKLDSRGQIDTVFGDAGIVEFDSPYANDRVGAIQQLQDGRIALLAWTRVDDFGAYECATDRTVLWYLSADGRQAQEVHAVAKDSHGGASCRSAPTLQADLDDQDLYRVLYGNEIGIFEGSNSLVPANWRYGPFVYFWYYPMFYTRISGPAIELLGGPTPSTQPRSYSTLGRAAGFGDEPITWNGMAIDHPDRGIYLGVSTDGGRVAIARLKFDGTLDTGWGGGDGIAVIEGAGVAGVYATEGIANDVRLLQRVDGGLIVATGDGMIRRLQVGSAASSGAFVLRPPLVSVTREGASRTFDVMVERAGSGDGVATVHYQVRESDCAKGQCPANWGIAKAGEDFVATSGVLRWEDGDVADKTIHVDLLGSTAAEPAELLVVELSNPSASAEIIDDWAYIFLAPTSARPPTSVPEPESAKGKSGGGASGPLLLLLLAGAGLLDRCRHRQPTLSRLGGRGLG
jgi:hypothetical protein